MGLVLAAAAMAAPFVLRFAEIPALKAWHGGFSGELAVTKPVDPLDFAQRVRPVLERRCFDCHGAEKQKGGLDLERFTSEAGAVGEVKIWESVRQQVTLHVMPPEGEEAPDAAERKLVADWIDARVFSPVDGRPDPGAVVLRRLNRVEYVNTMRDLLGVDFHPREPLPADDSGYGFDNIGSALTLSPLLLEKYLALADEVLDQALEPPAPRVSLRRIAPGEWQGGQRVKEPFCFVPKAGVVRAPLSVAVEGDYDLRLDAYGHQAGDEPVKISVKAGCGDPVEFDVPGTSEAHSPVALRVHLAAEAHEVVVTFRNDFDDPEAEDPLRRERNLIVGGVEIEGPFAPVLPPPPESHGRIFGSAPRDCGDAEVARRVLRSFAGRAWRRPAREVEVEKLLGLCDFTSAGQRLADRVRPGLEAALISPAFLFRVEEGGTPQADGLVALDDYALASRLSYFLWSTMPDQPLIHDAGYRKLGSTLPQQVRRMLADPRAEALTANFAGQWLQLRNLHKAPVDPALRASMQEESARFFRALVAGEMRVPELLTADFTWVDGRLAAHYGLPPVRGGGFERVSLRGTPRRGLLTQAGVLAITSHADRTSPTLRGKWVLENILGTPPPPAPQDVPPIERAELRDFHGTFRERLALHRSSPACASCHTAMDNLGFAFEHFDPSGRWRDTDGGLAIDASGRLLTGETFDGAGPLTTLLAQEKQDAFLEHFTRTLLTYALGRGLTHADQPAVQAIVREAAAGGWKFEDVVLAIARSVPFRLKRAE